MDNEELKNTEPENIDNNLSNEALSEEEFVELKEDLFDANEEKQDDGLCSKKKKYSPCLVATGLLATLSFIGVIVMFCLMFCGKNTSEDKTSTNQKIVQTGDLKIAYVNTDTILAQYDYAKDLEKGLKTYQTSLESNYQAQGKKLQSDYENYLKNGDKLTLTEQKKKEEDLTRRQQEFPMLQQKMMAQLQERQIEDNKKLLNAVYAFIKDYNAKNQKYNIILSRSYISSTVLYADEGFDITNQIVKGLNEEYKNLQK